MRILHYTLGFYPYRSGGLPKYAHDLMVAQNELGHDVFALYPGKMCFYSHKIRIYQDTNIDGIQVYELRNSLPVPLLYGVSNDNTFINDKFIDKENIMNFIHLVKPQVFHIHTLMGLPKTIIEIIKSEKIKIVYTTHDYYGLCTKVNFINNNNQTCVGPSANSCNECNKKSPSVLYLRLRNSKMLIFVKRILRYIK